MDTNKLIDLLSKSLNYTPVIYNQSSYKQENNDSKLYFIVEHQFTEIQKDSIFLFVPSKHAINGDNYLNIRTPYIANDKDTKYSYKDNILPLYVETNEGFTKKAEAGDIIPFRLCIIRFRTNGDQLIAIVCNSPLYNEAIYNKLTVRECSFKEHPKLIDPETNEEYRLVSIKELEALEERIEALEKRIIFGTEDPETALSSSDTGTIYIQYEED